MTVNIRSYKIQSKIGSGSFANVYKILEKSTGKFYAAKVLSTQYDSLEPEEKKNLKRELEIMTQLNHLAVIKFIGYSSFDFRRKRHPTFIMEYLPNETLNSILEMERSGNSPQSWDATKKLINIYGIASAMAYLHGKNIIHRDLKPENILMDEYLFPRIADFGLSKFSNTEQSTVYKGSPLYSPKEVHDFKLYSTSSDVYAFGLITYEIMTGKKPFGKVNEVQLLGKISIGERPEIDSTVPLSYKNLIEKCWSDNPSERPSFAEVIEMLENDDGFITDIVDNNEFLKYVDYVNIPQKSNSELLTESEIEAYMEGKSIEFSRVNINFKKKVGKELLFEEEEDIELFEELDDFALDKNTNREEVAKFYKESADKGNLYAMVKYGEMMFNGEGVLENKEEAVDFFIMAAEDGNLEGMTNYAIALMNGQGVEENKEKAVKLLRKASYKGNMKAMTLYGDALFEGIGVNVDKEKAIIMYKRAAEKGELESIVKYAHHLYNGDGIEADKVKAIEMYQRAADKGDVESMFFVGKAMYKGIDVPYDWNQAARYFKMAADSGHVKSILNYALMLYNGQGVKQDKAQSAEYYKRAAEMGDLKGMNNYALLLLQMNNLEPMYSTEQISINEQSSDIGPLRVSEQSNERISEQSLLSDDESFYDIIDERSTIVYRLLEKAAEQENLEAMNNFASYLYNGGIPSNMRKAVYFYRIAAEKGNPNAMNNYANILMNGDIVTPQNKDLAIQLYQKAANLGHKYAAYTYALILENEQQTSLINQQTVRYYLKIAADQYNRYAAYHYGRLLLDENKNEEAMRYFKIAADMGHIESCYLYGKNKYFGENEFADTEAGLYYIQNGKSIHKKSTLLDTMINFNKSCNIC